MKTKLKQLTGYLLSATLLTSCFSLKKDTTELRFNSVENNNKISSFDDDIESKASGFISINRPINNEAFNSRNVLIKGVCNGSDQVLISGTHIENIQTECKHDKTFSIELNHSIDFLSTQTKVSLLGPDGRMVEKKVSYSIDSEAPSLGSIVPVTGEEMISDSQVYNVEIACENGKNVALIGDGLTQVYNIMCSNNKAVSAVILTAGNGIKNFTASQTDNAGNTGSLSFSVELNISIQNNNQGEGELALLTPQGEYATSKILSLSGTCKIGSQLKYFVDGQELTEFLDQAQTGTSEEISLNTLVPLDFDGLGISQINGNEYDNDVLSISGDDITLVGAGTDIWSSKLSFVAAVSSEQIVGDFDISVQVKEMVSDHTYSKAGVMIYSDLSSRNLLYFAKVNKYSLGVFSGDGSQPTLDEDNFVKRSDFGSVFLRLQRVGNNLNLFYKDNMQENWIASPNNPYDISSLGNKVSFALASSAHSASKKMTSVYSHLDTGSMVQPSNPILTENNNNNCENGVFTYSFELADGDHNLKVVQAYQSESTELNKSILVDSENPKIYISNSRLDDLENPLNLFGLCEPGLILNITGVAQNQISCPTSGLFNIDSNLNAEPGSTQLVTVSQTDSAGNSSSSSKVFKLRALQEYDRVIEGTTSGRFTAAYQMIQNKCISCHDGSSGARADFSALTTEQDWINSRFVEPGNYKSILIQYLKHSNGNPATMPKGSIQFTENDFFVIADWVMGTPTSDDDALAEVGFTCKDPNEKKVESLLRLSKSTYINLLESFLFNFQVSEKSSFMSLLEDHFNALASDSTPGGGVEIYGFNNMDNRYNADMFNSHLGIAKEFAKTIFANSSYASKFMSKFCNSNFQADASCLDKFVKGFGLYSHRRPLSSIEIDEYKQLYTETNNSYEALVATFLSTVDFLYINHTNGTLVNGTYQLTPYEQVSKLAITFWDEGPDQTLFDYAKNAQSSRVNIDAVNYIFSTVNKSKLKNSMRRFYDDWFDTPNIPDIDKINFANFVFLSRDTNIGKPGYNHKEEMIQEIYDLFDYYIFDQQGTFTELFTSNLSFARKDGLAKIYNVPIWNGSSTPVQFPANERVGFISRAALLVNSTSQTNPFVLGARIKRRYLCDVISGPEGVVDDEDIQNAMTQVQPNPFMSTRERYQAKVQGDQKCMGCHVKFHDLGFALQDFDYLGRKRLKHYGITHELVNVNPFEETWDEVPVDLSVRVRPTFSDDTVTVGSVATIQHLAKSGKPQACYTKQMFKFLTRMPVDETTDSCQLEKYRKIISGDQKIIEFLKEFALAENFYQRRTE